MIAASARLLHLPLKGIEDMVRSWSIASLTLGAGLLLAGSAAAQPATDFIIEPGRRAGPVTRGMTEARLKALLPKGQVKRVLRPVGEGNYDCVTEIFSGTGNAAFINWGTLTKTYEEETAKTLRDCRDRPSPSKPQGITLERELDQPASASAWRTRNGIRLGMTVRELEAVMGEPFDFSVCACDYGGAILNTGGERKALSGIALMIDFPPDTEETLKGFIRVDEDFALKSSDVPEAVAKNFVVRQLIVSLAD
jgi:hypothetical protein